ncbi:phospholipase D-like domain-containing protein [Ensifer adhaerens]|jgi:hypothetical protein|uniref:hypothetical protein n=1 Tax=Ensifer adhaerens TaxID=106592 RepID=UPI00202FCDF1|nr:hypothetical protein [Ensifer adhaerens]
MILSDPEGVRAGLREHGACRAGRDYELEPVACSTGVFHPKLSLFFGETDAHMLVGSGNLTFGGWGMNLEVVEHVHPSFAAEAFDDAAELFELMSISEAIRSGAADRFERIATDLRTAAKGSPRNGGFRLLHSVGGSIGAQLADLAAELGGAERVTVVSPYFDVSGSAVSWLSQRLACDDVSLYVHPSGPVRGPTGINWPEGTIAKPVLLNSPFGDDDRQLHAKCIEVICRRGRLLMSGSANATLAALKSGNIEASLVRIQREAVVGWESKACLPPVHTPLAEDQDEDDKQDRIGVLRAVLEGDRIRGQVIEPALFGKASLQAVFASSNLNLGTVDLDPAGHFECAAADLEMLTWSGGRMVLRIEQEQHVAEGFVSVVAAAELIRRAGPLAPSLFAMLSGTETPQDAAHVITWYYEDPRRLMQVVPSGGGGHGTKPKDPVWIPLEALTTPTDGQKQPAHEPGHSETPAWQRALGLIQSAFSQTRGPWNSGTDQDDSTEDEGIQEKETDRHKRLARDEKAKAKTLDVFEKLLEKMLVEHHQGRHLHAALALAHYLTDRIRPPPALVHKWLHSIRKNIPAQRTVDSAVASVVLLTMAADRRPRMDATARGFLLHHKVDPWNLELDLGAFPAFVEVLLPGWDGEAFLAQVRNATTGREQVAAYLKAADEGGLLICTEK